MLVVQVIPPLGMSASEEKVQVSVSEVSPVVICGRRDVEGIGDDRYARGRGDPHRDGHRQTSDRAGPIDFQPGAAVEA